MAETRTCRDCGETQPETEFYVARRYAGTGKVSLFPDCKRCVRALERERYRRTQGCSAISRPLTPTTPVELSTHWLRRPL
jgi:hypothetical protein